MGQNARTASDRSVRRRLQFVRGGRSFRDRTQPFGNASLRGDAVENGGASFTRTRPCGIGGGYVRLRGAGARVHAIHGGFAIIEALGRRMADAGGAAGDSAIRSRPDLLVRGAKSVPLVRKAGTMHADAAGVSGAVLRLNGKRGPGIRVESAETSVRVTWPHAPMRRLRALALLRRCRPRRGCRRLRPARPGPKSGHARRRAGT